MDHSKEASYRTDLMTVTRHVLNEQAKHPEARGDLTILLSHIVFGCKYICSAINKAGLAKLIGLAGNSNVQGEEQKKLDVLSNEVFVNAVISSGRACILVSEENEEAIFVEPSKRGRYIVVFDPLDGSSNIDCGVSVGTIFGIYMAEDRNNPSLGDVLRPGKNMVAAGYCMYGSYCMLVLSTGCGVNGFTLDPSLGEFILTHPNIKIPKTGKIYSVNEGNTRNWDKPTAKYVETCKFPHDGSSPKSLRYIGRHVIHGLPVPLAWLLMFTELCFTGVSSCTLPTRKAQMENYVFSMKSFQCHTSWSKQEVKLLLASNGHLIWSQGAYMRGRRIDLGSHEDVEEIKELYAAFEDKNA